MFIKFLNVVYWLLCLLGFIWQIIEVSIIYFTFDVSTRVSSDVPISFKVPSLHACYRYVDVLNYSKLNQELKSNWSYSSYDGPAIRQLQHDLTIKNIYDFTPSEVDAIGSCRTKHPKSYEVPTYSYYPI